MNLPDAQLALYSFSPSMQQPYACSLDIIESESPLLSDDTQITTGVISRGNIKLIVQSD